jgi:hypothetical protein
METVPASKMACEQYATIRLDQSIDDIYKYEIPNDDTIEC